jgi:hypothetical protein
MQRAFLGLAMGSALAFACWHTVSHYFSLPTLHAKQVLPASFWTRGNVRRDLAIAAAQSVRPIKALLPSNVYPYSIVPGGLKDASDLRYAALRDYVVRRHYARFNYNQARLLRVTEAREVYLSYRIRDRVFWTRRKARLHRGELLLTDGKITARARCGNQISDTAQPEVSDEEPEQDVLDHPVTALGPSSFPVRPMLSAPELPAFDPAAPKLFASAFIFPYMPVGVPLPSGRCPANDTIVDGHCHKTHPKRPVIPEPPTMVLAASGIAFMLWRFRSIARPADA